MRQWFRALPFEGKYKKDGRFNAHRVYSALDAELTLSGIRLRFPGQLFIGVRPRQSATHSDCGVLGAPHHRGGICSAR